MSYQQYRPTSFKVLPLVVKNLLIINGLFFLATWVFQNQYEIDLTNYLGLHYFSSQYFRPYQLITYMFMHGGFDHLFFNMFALWMFGNALENFWGPKRFLIFYMATGIGAALIYMGYQSFQYFRVDMAVNDFLNNPIPEEYYSLVKKYFSSYLDIPQNQSEIDLFVSQWSHDLGNKMYSQHALNDINQLVSFQKDNPMIGASGAVFGILLAFGMLFPNTLLYVYFLIPIKAKWFVILYGVAELYSGIANNPGDNVAHFAHLGGMLIGFVLIKYWQKKNKSFY
jgi:membrane associated rhomboid family serine protease